MILAVIFQHSNSFIHKSISIFSRSKHPNTDSLLTVVDGFQLVIYLANLLRYIGLRTNHSFPLNRPRRFGGDVVDDTINAAHFIDNPR